MTYIKNAAPQDKTLFGVCPEPAVAASEENIKRDVADMRRLQNTWASQQLLMKRDWLR